MGSKDQIHKAVAFPDLFNHCRFLHHAAAQSDLHMRIFLFQSIQIAKSSIDSLIGIVPDGTGIVNNKISLFLLYQFIAHLFQDTGKLLGIPCIHLAPEGNYTAGRFSAKLF